MLDWLKALVWGRRPPFAGTAVKQPTETAPTVRADDSRSVIDVDGIYYGWLLGVRSPTDGPMSPLEQGLLEGLDRAAASALSDSTLVPRVPTVIPRLLKSLRDDDMSGAQLAGQIARDPGLVADIVRIANSPYYRTATAIRSLEHAVTVLGRNGLRQLIAAAALKPIINLQVGHFAHLAAPKVWAHSQLCATVCSCLGRAERLDAFEPYLAGVLHNVGLVVALRVMDQQYDSSDAPRSATFHRAFASRARLLSHRILLTWELPAAVTEALGDQVAARSTPMTRLGAVLFAGDQVSKLRMLVDNGLAEDRLDRLTCRLAGRLTDSCSRCYAELSAVGAR
ncbi:MAG: HDOD domain-containing protein [Gammaproteobacteria bacterium]